MDQEPGESHYDAKRLNITNSLERQAEKRNIEAQIETRMTSHGLGAALNDINFADYWEQADTAARKQFGDLSERQMLNGFYLQEVMHRYAELITNAILL